MRQETRLYQEDDERWLCSTKTTDELADFLESVCYFHDCCIVDVHYISGAYCSGGWMHPENDQRELRVHLQGWCAGVLIFQGLRFCRLSPQISGTCEILGASMWADDTGVFWCDDDVRPETVGSYSGTVICAESVTWLADSTTKT